MSRLSQLKRKHNKPWNIRETAGPEIPLANCTSGALRCKPNSDEQTTGVSDIIPNQNLEIQSQTKFHLPTHYNDCSDSAKNTRAALTPGRSNQNLEEACTKFKVRVLTADSTAQKEISQYTPQTHLTPHSSESPDDNHERRLMEKILELHSSA